jgi:hypothetical protein
LARTTSLADRLCAALATVVALQACRVGPPPTASRTTPPRTQIGIYLPVRGLFFLCLSEDCLNRKTFQFGSSNLKPIAGDWDGDGRTTIGVYNALASTFFLNNDNSAGLASIVVRFGPPDTGWLPIAGDWDGDGRDSVGLYDPLSSMFHLRKNTASNSQETMIQFGTPAAGLLPLAGDWEGTGRTSVGVYDPATAMFSLRRADGCLLGGGPFLFGPPHSIPISGDWADNGHETVGVLDPANERFLLRGRNSEGPPDHVVSFSRVPAIPLAGHWAEP